jgi:hypothetical protein
VSSAEPSACDGQRLADVVHLAHADLLWPERAGVFQPAKVHREQQSLAQLHSHIGQFGLSELECGDRAAELDA